MKVEITRIQAINQPYMHNDLELQELTLKMMTHYRHTWAILNIFKNLLFRLGHITC
jgi:hypothetical protein